MELVDILVLGTSALVRVGSNPTEGNTLVSFKTDIKMNSDYDLIELKNY